MFKYIEVLIHEDPVHNQKLATVPGWFGFLAGSSSMEAMLEELPYHIKEYERKNGDKLEIPTPILKPFPNLNKIIIIKIGIEANFEETTPSSSIVYRSSTRADSNSNNQK